MNFSYQFLISLCIPVAASWLFPNFLIHLFFYPARKWEKQKTQWLQQLQRTITFAIEQQKQQLNNEAILALIEQKMDEFLDEKLPKTMPAISLFMNHTIATEIKQILLAEFKTILPEIVQNYARQLTTQPFQNTILLPALNNREAKLFLKKKFKKQFQLFQYVCIIFGIFIAFLQLIILL
jgi:translation elongation factor EF-G